MQMTFLEEPSRRKFARAHARERYKGVRPDAAPPWENDTEQLAFAAPPPSSRTPINYMGGKNALAPTVHLLMPPEITEIASPFVGGASVELYLAAHNIRVHASDNMEPLVTFWQVFQKNPARLASVAAGLYPQEPEELKHLIYGGFREITDPLKKAAYFWVINKQSWCGKTLHSFCAATNVYPDFFAPYKWESWQNPNIEFQYRDYRDALAEHHDKYLYLDPPYIGLEHYYRQWGDDTVEFDHAELAALLKAHQPGWIMSYGNHPRIWDLYQEFSIETPTWKYGSAKKDKKARELLITKPCS